MADASGIMTFIILVIKIIIAYIITIIKLFEKKERKSVKGQNILITGSGQGFGRLLALKFARLGANIALLDINKDRIDEVKKDILSQYPSVRVKCFVCDITNEEKVSRLPKEISEELGPVDILINNAGVVQCKPVLELSPKLVERTFNVNSLSHIWTIKHFLPSMLERKRGHIVGIASIAGIHGVKYLTDYCGSKFAVVGLMDAFEKEIHDNEKNPDIHVTTICPSSMNTGMFQSFTTRWSWFLPILDPEDVANASIDAILFNRKFIVIPWTAQFCSSMTTILPERVSALTQAYLDYGVNPHSN